MLIREKKVLTLWRSFLKLARKKTNSKVDKVLFAYVQVTNDKGKNIQCPWQQKEFKLKEENNIFHPQGL